MVGNLSLSVYRGYSRRGREFKKAFYTTSWKKCSALLAGNGCFVLYNLERTEMKKLLLIYVGIFCSVAGFRTDKFPEIDIR